MKVAIRASDPFPRLGWQRTSARCTSLRVLRRRSVWHPRREQGVATVCLHELGGNRRLSFRTGYCEAWGLDVALKHVAPPRPLPYHLMTRIVTDMGGRLERGLVDRYIEADHIYHSELQRRSRPATGIANGNRTRNVLQAIVTRLARTTSRLSAPASERRCQAGARMRFDTLLQPVFEQPTASRRPGSSWGIHRR